MSKSKTARQLLGNMANFRMYLKIDLWVYRHKEVNKDSLVAILESRPPVFIISFSYYCGYSYYCRPILKILTISLHKTIKLWLWYNVCIILVDGFLLPLLPLGEGDDIVCVASHCRR